jgi:hypothetical protein
VDSDAAPFAPAAPSQPETGPQIAWHGAHLEAIEEAEKIAQNLPGINKTCRHEGGSL